MDRGNIRGKGGHVGTPGGFQKQVSVADRDVGSEG